LVNVVALVGSIITKSQNDGTLISKTFGWVNHFSKINSAKTFKLTTSCFGSRARPALPSEEKKAPTSLTKQRTCQDHFVRMFSIPKQKLKILSVRHYMFDQNSF